MSVIHSVIESNEIMNWKSIEWQGEGKEQQSNRQENSFIGGMVEEEKQGEKNILVKR